MSNYTQSTNFATKDALSSGDPLKIVKGTEINTEFVNISVAIATKADLASPTFSGTPSLPTGTTGVTQSAGTSNTTIATTAFVAAAATAAVQLAYPVGSIYTAVVSTNPSTLLGFGTWTAFSAGRVMVGFNASNALFDTAEETGGSADATLVSHTHTFSGSTSTASLTGTFVAGKPNGATGIVSFTNLVGGSGSGDQFSGGQYSVDASHSHTLSGTTGSSGSSATNANYQPYITVYMWKRTA